MNALRAVLRGTGELLITAGLVVLLFLVWQLWWTDVTAGRVQHAQAQQLQRQWEQNPPHATPSTSTSEPAELQLTEGEAFALIRIPRFGRDFVRPVIEGTDMEVLDRGVGHYVGTAQPGQLGNFAVAGHRVTYAKPFNRIDELRDGDPVVVETAAAYYVYRVVGRKIVTPDQVDVIDPVPEHPGERPTRRMMTMTACHPEFSARQRYVLWSELEQTVPRSQGPPDVLKG